MRSEKATAEDWFYLGMSQIKSDDAEAGNTALQKAVEMGLPEEIQQEAERALAE